MSYFLFAVPRTWVYSKTRGVCAGWGLWTLSVLRAARAVDSTAQCFVLHRPPAQQELQQQRSLCVSRRPRLSPRWVRVMVMSGRKTSHYPVS